MRTIQVVKKLMNLPKSLQSNEGSIVPIALNLSSMN